MTCEGCFNSVKKVINKNINNDLIKELTCDLDSQEVKLVINNGGGCDDGPTYDHVLEVIKKTGLKVDPING